MTTVQLALGLRSLAFGIWFGGGLAMLLATRAIFARAGSRALAGTISGEALLRFQLLRGLAAVLLGGAALFGARGLATLLGLGCILFQLASSPVDSRLRNLRSEIGGSTEGLAEDDPRRKQFGVLHGISILLLLAQIALAAVALVLPV